MGFESIKKLVDDVFEGGQECFSSFLYTPTIVSIQGQFFDLSQSPGNPYKNLYSGTPLTATAFPADSGIWHGGNVSPLSKFLYRMTAQSATAGVVPARLILCDFLLYYPYIDLGASGRQTFINSISLPRYADGQGVYMFLASTTNYAGTGTVWVDYVDANGISNQTLALTLLSTNLQGVVMHSSGTNPSRGPFMQIGNARGVRYPVGIEFSTLSSGLAALVLARPIAEIKIREINCPVEVNFLLDRNELPRIYDGAHLNFLISPNGSMSGVTIMGDLNAIWG